MAGPFVMLSFGDDVNPQAVFIENLTGSSYLEQPAELAGYTRVWEALTASALSPDRTAEMIAGLIDEAKEHRDHAAG